MTRKLPADIPSPEERGGHRPDEPEQGFAVSDGEPVVTVGLLGVVVPAEYLDHPRHCSDLRLAEIERRILEIEARGK